MRGRRSVLRFVVTTLLLSALPAVAAAQLLGTELQVNSYTSGHQYRSAVAPAADGGFVVVWESDGSAADTSYTSIQGQRFDATGGPVGSQFQVNTYFTGRQTYPAVASDAAGNFVVVWESRYGSSYRIQGQRYDSSGATVGGEFQVSTTGSGHRPAVAMHATATVVSFSCYLAGFDPGFVVVWYSQGSAGFDTSGFSIQARIYDASGNPRPPGQFQINSETTGNQWFPTVAMAPFGGFVVAWGSETSDGSDSSDQSIQAKLFECSGNDFTPEEFQLNSYTTGTQTFPAVSVDPEPLGSTWVVAWHSQGSAGSDTSGFSIQGRRFSGDSPLGPDFQVNTYTQGHQVFPGVVMRPGGEFAVLWESNGSPGGDTSGPSIQAQPYDSAGVPLGGQFQVNTYTTGGQYRPAVAADTGGRFVVAWQSGAGDGSGYGIFGRRFVTPLAGSTVVELAVTYEEPTIVSGPLSLGLGALPSTVEARFRFVSPGFPPPLGVPLEPTVLAASLSVGDLRAGVEDLNDFSVTFDGSPAAIVGLSYSFGPITTATALDGIFDNDFELNVEGVDKATGEPFQYRHARSSEVLELAIAPACPPAPDPGCVTGFAKGLLSVDERKPGGEKLLVKWTGGPALLGTDFGNPLGAGGTAYRVCVYDDGGALAGQYAVDRAGYLCRGRECWKALGKPPGSPRHKGYRYKDGDAGADGLLLARLAGGAAGRSQALVKGRGATLPTGVAAALAGSTAATVQLAGSDAPQCVSIALPTVVRDDGTRFKARLP